MSRLSLRVERDILMVGGIALVVRLVGMIVSQRSFQVVAMDTAAIYLPIARSLVSGGGFRLSGSAVEASRIPPLFPLWLSALMQMTGPQIPVWVAGVGNAGLRASACILLFVICRRYFGRSAAIAAVALYIADPWESFWVGFLLKESLAIPLVMLSAWLLVKSADRPTPSRFALVGAAIGVATLARFANGALWFAAAIIAFVSARPAAASRWIRGGVLAGAMSLGMLAALSPWLIRNWRVVGEPVLTTRFVGRKLYTSNGPGISSVTDGYYAPKMDPSVAKGLSDSTRVTAQEAELASLTIRHVLAHPGEVLTRAGEKLVNMWRPTFKGSSRRNLILLGLPYIGLLALSLAGIAMAIRRRIPCAGLAIPLAVFFSVHLVFRGEIRNRQYLMPLLHAFGGLAVVTVVGRAHRGSSPARG